MILVDTGPLVALFDPRDRDHEWAKTRLAAIRGPLVTTVCVATEVFHLLDPASRGAAAFREFIEARGLLTWFLTEASLARALELMAKYAGHPMDLADASLVAAAESLRTTTVFTLDRKDFTTYRVRFGRATKRFRVLA